VTKVLPGTIGRMIKRILITAPVTLVLVGIAAAEAFAGNTNEHAQLLPR
jgi:hypothetical protein